MRSPVPPPAALAVLGALSLSGCEASTSPASSASAPSLAVEVSASSAPAGEPGATATGEAAGGIGDRVFVVQRERQSLAVYDISERALLPVEITGFGDMRHAVMAFGADLRWGYVATRSGQVTRIDLSALAPAGTVMTSQNSIDIAISQDGRWLATAEYSPGGVTLVDTVTLEVAGRLTADWTDGSGQAQVSRVTGIVDAPRSRFVCVAMESGEVWIVDATAPPFAITHRVSTVAPAPYDAMITPDGRWYVVAHLDNDALTVVDLDHPELGARSVVLDAPGEAGMGRMPVKLPHLASWASARGRMFVPWVGEARIAVVNPTTWTVEATIPLLGNPVYAVRSPTEREVWVSFSGTEHDRFIQVVDTESLTTTGTIEVGRRIYHMDFTPRGNLLMATANAENQFVVIDTASREIVDREIVDSPSGIFGPWRAYRLGL